MEKSTKVPVYTAFMFMGHPFWKENIEDRVKLLESNILNCCLKITMADLHKIGLTVGEWHFWGLSSYISQQRPNQLSLTPLYSWFIQNFWGKTQGLFKDQNHFFKDFTSALFNIDWHRMTWSNLYKPAENVRIVSTTDIICLDYCLSFCNLT